MALPAAIHHPIFAWRWSSAFFVGISRSRLFSLTGQHNLGRETVALAALLVAKIQRQLVLKYFWYEDVY
jgi:hypothetical protein